jgi:hypothetical protein
MPLPGLQAIRPARSPSRGWCGRLTEVEAPARGPPGQVEVLTEIISWGPEAGLAGNKLQEKNFCQRLLTIFLIYFILIYIKII